MMKAKRLARTRRRSGCLVTVLLDITVPGTPVGAARPRVVRLKTGASHTFMPDGPVRWEHDCVLYARAGILGTAYGVPVSVEITAHHARPERLCRKKDPVAPFPAMCKPDIDNVAKLVLDALVKAGVMDDDTQVVELVARRMYLPHPGACGAGDRPRVHIVVRAVQPGVAT